MRIWVEMQTRTQELGGRDFISNNSLISANWEQELANYAPDGCYRVCNTQNFNNLWDYRSSELVETESDTPLDEFVFCHFDGSSIGKMNKSFGSLMEYCDTQRDVYGEKYTIYSLGHFYAQMRLNEEVSVYDLASQMGTSVEMISRFYDQPNNVVRGLNITKSSKQKSSRDYKYPYE